MVNFYSNKNVINFVEEKLANKNELDSSKFAISSDEELILTIHSMLKGWDKNTWSYFETLMNEENNYLPPDNFQEDPPNGVAYRTSPTNIGLGMLAILSAYVSLAIGPNQ